MLCAGIIFSATKLVLFISRCPLSTAYLFILFLRSVIIRKHGKHHIYVGFWTVYKFTVQFLHQGKRLVPLFPTGREQGYQMLGTTVPGLGNSSPMYRDEI